MGTDAKIAKRAAVALISSLVLLGAAASVPALAWGHDGGGHVHFGIVIGGPLYPWYYPPYYYAPYYYPPAAVAVPAAPPAYVERGGPQAAPGEQQQPAYWYYCAGSKTYYPYVKECPGGWQRVTPVPPR